MKKQIQRPQRPTDPNQLAHSVMQDVIALTEKPPIRMPTSIVMVFQCSPTEICFRQIGAEPFEFKLKGKLATNQALLGKGRNSRPC